MSVQYYLVSRKDSCYFELGKDWSLFKPSGSYCDVRKFVKEVKEPDYDNDTDQSYFDLISRDISKFCFEHKDVELLSEVVMDSKFNYEDTLEPDKNLQVLKLSGTIYSSRK